MRDPLYEAQHDLYLLNRTRGDIRAAERGPDALAKRLLRREFHRMLFRWLRRMGL